MKNQRIIRVAIMMIMIAIGVIIELYYWSVDTLEGITEIPMHVLILALCYILIQIAKRYFFKKQNWWDWLYYIGLLAMMLPTVLATDSNATVFHLVTDYGTLFLIFPILLDGKQMMDGKQ